MVMVEAADAGVACDVDVRVDGIGDHVEGARLRLEAMWQLPFHWSYEKEGEDLRPQLGG